MSLGEFLCVCAYVCVSVCVGGCHSVAGCVSVYVCVCLRECACLCFRVFLPVMLFMYLWLCGCLDLRV